MKHEIVKGWVNDPVLIQKAAEIGIHEYLSEEELIEACTFATIAIRGQLTEEHIESMTVGGEGAQVVLNWLIHRMPRMESSRQRIPQYTQGEDLF